MCLFLIKLCKGLPELSQCDSFGHLFSQIFTLSATACLGIFFFYEQNLINVKTLRVLKRFFALIMVHCWLKPKSFCRYNCATPSLQCQACSPW